METTTISGCGTILLVEDDSNDIFRVERALRQAGIINPLAVVHNGLEALHYLTATEHACPMLVLVDLDMPVMNGFELLVRLRRNPQFEKLPVVIFTGSASCPDVARAYRLGANSVLTKPAEVEQLKVALEGMIQFWCAGQVGVAPSVKAIAQEAPSALGSQNPSFL